MKTKCYSLLTCLLMVVCATSYGQELIGEFVHSNGFLNSSCEILEAADGNLLIGSNTRIDDTTAYFVVLKYTPEGELLDSLSFPNRCSLWATNPTNPETQVYAAFVTDDTPSVKIAFVGSDFCVTDALLVPIPNYDEHCTSYGSFFFDRQNDIIASYWNGDLFHFLRIGLDGTLKQDKEVEGLFPQANKPDTTVYYMGSKLFNNSPQQFSLLGDIYDYYRWPVVGYTFDEDFNNIDKHVYYLVKDEILVNGGMGEHLTSFDDESYLLAARIEHGYYGYAGLIKYSRAHHEPLKIQLFEGNDPYRYNVAPSDTKVLDDHSLYFTYLTHVTANNSVALLRISPDLDPIWRVTFPDLPQQTYGDAMITVLGDGRIVIVTNVYRDDYTKSDLRVFIVHDSYDSTSETAAAGRPFTLLPNPVKDLLSLRFDDGVKPESVELYNLAGSLVAAKRDVLESIDMNALSSGVYMLRVTMKDGSCYHDKIIKE